jgi:organic hydroperoxide reductase OsmC/OhrA
MAQYPMSFSVRSQATSGIATRWTTSVPSFGDGLVAAIPPEFGGPGGGYSPEDFYAFSVLNCFLATFKVIAERSKFEFGSIALDGKLTVDRNESGAPWMKAFHLKAVLSGVGDRERAPKLLEKTSQSCLVLNSIKTEKTFEFVVE